MALTKQQRDNVKAAIAKHASWEQYKATHTDHAGQPIRSTGQLLVAQLESIAQEFGIDPDTTATPDTQEAPHATPDTQEAPQDTPNAAPAITLDEAMTEIFAGDWRDLEQRARAVLERQANGITTLQQMAKNARDIAAQAMEDSLRAKRERANAIQETEAI